MYNVCILAVVEWQINLLILLFQYRVQILYCSRYCLRTGVCVCKHLVVT